jgi:predicted transcriptional regulator
MGVVLPLKEITLKGEEALKVADALTSASFRILQLISEQSLDVSTIAEKLDFSEPYVSEQIRRLEELKLVKVRYEPGKRGIRKVCELAVKKIIIVIKS